MYVGGPTPDIRMGINLKTKCDHVHRVSVHPSVRIGGASLGQCEKDAAPGLTCCWEHATKECLIYYVQHLLRQESRLKRECSKFNARIANSP